MPPRNIRGGKSYKKGKKTGGGADEEHMEKFSQREPGQDYGRVLRMLGDRRVLCFCNDGSERVCKIRQALCKGPNKKKIEVADIVLLSFRDFEEPEETNASGIAGSSSEIAPTSSAKALVSGRKEIADLLEKYSRNHWQSIKKEAGIHRDLFPVTRTTMGDDLDDIFDSESEEGGENENENEKDVNIDEI